MEQLGVGAFPEIRVSSGVTRDRLLDFYGDFRSEMGDLMKTLLTEDKDLELSGISIPADQKTGVAGTYLIQEWMSEQEFVFGQLLDAYKFEQSLENKINNFSFS